MRNKEIEDWEMRLTIKKWGNEVWGIRNEDWGMGNEKGGNFVIWR